MTQLLLWEEYLASCVGQPYKYAQFCVHYRQYNSRLKLTMRQTHKVGEKLFVDYSGDGVPIVDPLTGEIRLVQLDVRLSGLTVEALHKGQRVASGRGGRIVLVTEIYPL